MSKKEDSITLSPKYGVNPSIVHCRCCGETYGVAMLGKLKGDQEAPKDIYDGLCKTCEGVINQGGVMVIEVKDGENVDNPYRTGRVIGATKEFKKEFNITSSMVYMEESAFSRIFKNVGFSKEDSTTKEEVKEESKKIE